MIANNEKTLLFKQLDKRGNEISATILESLLGKFIIEYSSIYQKLFFKVTQSIKQVIDYNNDIKLDRYLFLLFSTISADYPEYKSINDFLIEDVDLNALIVFYTYFFEKLIPLVKVPDVPHKNDDSLAVHLQSYFRLSPKAQKKLFGKLHPASLFSENARGRKELDLAEITTTTDLGIMCDETGFMELKNYFNTPFEAAKYQFETDENSAVVIKMRQLGLPFISGPSGTMAACLQGLIRVGNFSVDEIKTFIMVFAAYMVAHGHHSFYESMMVAKEFGFNYNISGDKQLLYESILTDDFKNSDNYKNFLDHPDVKAHLSQDNKSTPVTCDNLQL